MREMIRSWRFYDHFRTDVDAPARLPQLGTRTPVLHHDGRDLAAALQTIREIGDAAALSISWGAAVGWMFAEQLGVQADATRIESAIQYWNLGLVYRF